MKPYIVNALNGVTLIALSLWAYSAAEDPSPTAFIPAGFGVVFLVLTSGVKNENKIVAHVVVLLTLLVIIALAMPLKGAIERGDTIAVVRVAIMEVTSILAMISFIRSFIEARKARNSA